ncbi:hypothetical protein SLS62_006869 [Diatrype stigma]|uniref:Uncharacterized protein n=1 Tax=Diatrype stigma TaxID=117547 RepID=A0AAN9UML5_9PEZI
MAKKLVGRADDDGLPPGYYLDEDGRYRYFWDTRTGIIIKWSLFLAFVLFITVWMVLGRRHALRRVRAGRKPAPGTGWLLSRQERGLVDPRYAAPWPGQAVYVQYHPGGPQAPAGSGPGGWYNMQNMPPPPPVYDANRPPMYDGGDSNSPAGATKVDPDQQGAAGRDDYAPPAGPPPGAGLR